MNIHTYLEAKKTFSRKELIGIAILTSIPFMGFVFFVYALIFNPKKRGKFLERVHDFFHRSKEK